MKVSIIIIWDFIICPIVYDKKADDLSSNIYHSNININCFRCLIHASDMLSFSLETSENDFFCVDQEYAVL